MEQACKLKGLVEWASLPAYVPPTHPTGHKAYMQGNSITETAGSDEHPTYPFILEDYVLKECVSELKMTHESSVRHGGL